MGFVKAWLMWLAPLFHHGPRWLEAERNARSSVTLVLETKQAPAAAGESELRDENPEARRANHPADSMTASRTQLIFDLKQYN